MAMSFASLRRSPRAMLSCAKAWISSRRVLPKPWPGRPSFPELAIIELRTHMNAKLATNDLEAFWMPFTANRQYKNAPRLLVSAQGMYYMAADGRRVLDGTSGLWCVNAGHCRPKIVDAVRKQVGELDFAGSFQMGHPRAFECAAKLANIAPPAFDHVFFTNSGS